MIKVFLTEGVKNVVIKECSLAPAENQEVEELA